MKIDPAELKALLDYDPDTGKLTHRHRLHATQSWNTRWAGKTAGALMATGYIGGNLHGAIYYAHRVIWAWMTGEWPAGQIDHINGNRVDNRWVNIRAATKTQNNRNTSIRRNNTSGFKGVSYSKSTSKPWLAKITHDRQQRYLGIFATPEEAHAAYAAAATRLHGEFANTGTTP